MNPSGSMDRLLKKKKKKIRIPAVQLAFFSITWLPRIHPTKKHAFSSLYYEAGFKIAVVFCTIYGVKVKLFLAYKNMSKNNKSCHICSTGLKGTFS